MPKQMPPEGAEQSEGEPCRAELDLAGLVPAANMRACTGEHNGQNLHRYRYWAPVISMCRYQTCVFCGLQATCIPLIPGPQGRRKVF